MHSKDVVAVVVLLLFTGLVWNTGTAAPVSDASSSSSSLLSSSSSWSSSSSSSSLSSDDRQKRESFDAISVLTKYGYLQVSSGDAKTSMLSDLALGQAIRSYQSFNGLEVTGQLDQPTLAKMKSPRCGVKDKDATTGVPSKGGMRPDLFTALGTKWGKDAITWKPTSYSEKLPQGQQWLAFRKAFDVWREAIPVSFRYVEYEPDVEIGFARGDHGDGWENKFDGKGNVLAHAYSPGSGIGGDTHFDADEGWTVGSGEGTDLTTVAAHEFGHALGLGHSSVPGALMAPYYRYKGDPTLHADDILGVQSLYGVRPTTKAPKPTTPTLKPTTTTTTTTEKILPDFCNDRFRLDAISEGGDGYMYAFRLDKVYKIGPNGLENGFPKVITQIFPGGPKQHIRAVSYVPENKKFYVFKDLRVWRFTDVSQGHRVKVNEADELPVADFRLDEGYPKQITTDSYYRPSAAITLTYKGVSQLFLFSWDYFWEWDIRSERIVPGYPLSSSAYFPHAPGLPDAAMMNGKGNIHVFKYNTYKFLHHRGMDGESQPLGPNLFGAACDGQPTIFQHGDFAERARVSSDAIPEPAPPSSEPGADEMELPPQLWPLVILRQIEMAFPKIPANDDPSPTTPLKGRLNSLSKGVNSRVKSWLGR